MWARICGSVVQNNGYRPSMRANIVYVDQENHVNPTRVLNRVFAWTGFK